MDMNFQRAVRDPFINVIEQGIKGDIRCLLGAERFRGAMQLTLSGIDVMASLSRPAGKAKVDRQDFMAWVRGYLYLGHPDAPTPEEIYGARCGLLHAYESASAFSATGGLREICYLDRSVPTVLYNPEVSTEIVMVSVPAFVQAFFRGIDGFRADVVSDPTREAMVRERFATMFHVLPALPLS